MASIHWLLMMGSLHVGSMVSDWIASADIVVNCSPGIIADQF